MSLDPITAVLDIGGKVIDRLWPTKEDADKAKLKLLEMQQTGELAVLAAETDLAKGQISVNEAEAANPNLFVSGARPAILWICGIAMAYAAIIEPVARFIAQVCVGYGGAFPVLNTELTLQVLLGLLGLGGLRTYEKVKNVAR